jgi:hypothetical protein
VNDVPADKDIFGKADGLMRRNVGVAGVGTDTGGVPVLTELVGEAAKPAIREPAGDLAREIFTRVIAEVEGRLAADLERRVSEHLMPQVHAAVASAVSDLHQELANVIGDAVTRALDRRHLK